MAALVRHLRHTPFAPRELDGLTAAGAGFLPWLTSLGSLNQPPLAHAALGDWRWHVELARAEKQRGLYLRELGSPYNAGVLVARMSALADARAAGEAATAEPIRDALRATWAYWALTALETPRQEAWGDLAGKIARPLGDARYYCGLSTPLAGERYHPQSLGQDYRGALLTWALDWPGRRWTRKMLGPEERRDPSEVLLATRLLLGGADYAAPAPPEPFGLTAAEREVLRQTTRGDPRAAAEAAAMVDFPLWPGYRLLLLRRAGGTAQVLLGDPACLNGNKPCWPAASLLAGGTFRALQPSPFGGGGLNRGVVCSFPPPAGGSVACVSADRGAARVEMPLPQGEVAWIYEWSSAGLRQLAAPPWERP